MTNFKKVLLASATLTLFTGAAWAGSDNSAIVDQFGSNNSLYIDQDVNNDGANHNEVGWTGDSYKQQGSNNDIRIVQGGNRNISDGSTYGEYNVIRINQAGSTNSFTRTDTDVGSHNNLSITQSGDQQNATLNVTGNYNALAVNQSGAKQTANVNIAGSNNNTGSNYLFGPASEFGLARGALTQSGSDNNIDLTVANGANNNAFAISQNGTLAGWGNKVTGTISGSYGAVGIVQVGANNTTTFNQGGVGNSLAIKQ